MRWAWGALIWVFAAGAAEAAVELRVAIESATKNLRIGSSTAAIVRDDSGRQVGTLSPLQSLDAKVSGNKVSLADRYSGNRLWIEPKDDGYIWIGQRWYRGRLQLARVGTGRMAAVNYVDLEHYLYGVVGAEAVSSWPLEALKAQAVAARTYALYERSRAKGKLFDLSSTTHSQVYRGITSESIRTHQAVNETVGQVVIHDGRLILAAFHASSGGHTENVEDVWSKPLPYLRGVADYDRGTPVYEWTETISGDAIGAKIGLGTIRSIAAERTTPRGRVLSLKLVDAAGKTKRLSGDEFRKAFNLRSTLFQVSPYEGVFFIVGRGFGHGVGMSQWGAYNLALQGANYQQILGHYYQSAVLARLEVQ